MNIKKIIKYSFILISFLVIVLATINSAVLMQIEENNISSNNIEELVYVEENMNSLLKDAMLASELDNLNEIKKHFFKHEKHFENLNKSFILNDEDDLLDMFIPDIHNNMQIKRNLKLLVDNEKIIEGAFDKIINLQREKIELINKFNEEYPLENKIRKQIEADILKTQSISLLRSFSNLKYYSKETLYQHKNRNYLNKWLNEIALIKENFPQDYLDVYKNVVQKLGSYVLRISEIELSEVSLEKDVLKIIKLNSYVNENIQKMLEEVSSTFTAKVNNIIFILLIFTISFIIILSYKVYKNVGLTVDEIEYKVQHGLKKIKKLNKEIEYTQKEVVFTMGAIGESRSKETGNHVKRVAEYSKILALYYGLPPKVAEMLKQASPMHDIGKVAIPDAVLNKPGRFDERERKIMDTHAELGYEMLKYSDRPLLKMASIVAYEHHEKYNGKGYPQGLKGEDIHIYGRITALADVFDALGSHRVYKKAWDDEKIFALFRDERGEHFDPNLIDIFFNNLDEFLVVREGLRDKF